ncbi:MAG: HD domain-containing phosphohydrolase [Spirochaetota bacterium]
MPRNEKPVILVVDDVAENRKILATIINRETNYSVTLASDGNSVLSMIENDLPDLILLDIMMPGMDGFAVARILKSKERTQEIPILFITAVIDIESIVKAFEAGGVDYITKPFSKNELLARVNAHIQIKKMRDELKEKNELLADRELHLIQLVEEKTRKLEKTTIALVNALENANFFNDNDTGNHIKRVSEYSALIAAKYGCDRDFVKRIKMYASLHDVGKVGIPDSLLKKPGKYTSEEFEKMQAHVVIGARMLDDPEIDPMARHIALYHHEKWDGGGYIHKVRKKDIPLEARMVALADVFDALSNKRVYKEAYPENKVDTIIKESENSHFDPDLVNIYFENKPEMMEIKKKFSD